VIKNIDFSTCKYIGDQFTKINFYLWPYLFEEKLRPDLSNLVSIENDSVVVEYLIHILRNERESYIYKMMFDNSFREKVIAEFSGVPGAWDDERGVGTFFFWGLDENNERRHLRFENDSLVSKDESYKVGFDAESLIPELEAKRIYPGMLLKFSLLLFYIGMKPLAGYSLEYLTRMKERMIKILKDDFPLEAELVKSVPLDNMNLISICKGRDANGNLKDLHAFDIFYQGGFSAEYMKNLDRIKFKEFMVPFLLFAYGYGLGKYGDSSKKVEFPITEAQLQKPLESLFI